MTLITLGLVCTHLGRQPGACRGTHRWLAGIALARWLEPPLPTLGLRTNELGTVEFVTERQHNQQ